MIKNTFKRVCFIYKKTQNDCTFTDSISYNFNLNENSLILWINNKIHALSLIHCIVTSYVIYEVTEIFVKSVIVGDNGGEQLEI